MIHSSNGVILFIVNFYPPHVGGLERYTEGLARALAKASNHEIHIITHRDRPHLPDLELTPEGIRVHRIDSLFCVADVLCIPHPIQLWKVLRSFSTHSISGISIHTRFFPISLLGALFGKWKSAKVIFTEHGSDYVRFPSSKLIELFSKIYDLTLGRWTIALATIRSGSSQSAARFVEHLGGQHVRILENAVDLDFWSEKSSKSRKDSNNTHTVSDHFIYIGRIASGKGWDIAVRAHQSQEPEFRKKYPLILIGDGTEVDRLIDMIQQDPCIQFLGPQGPDIIRTHLDRAITLNPTQLSESLQTILIEAAATQSWILSSPTPEAVQFLQQGFGRIVTSDWAQAMRESIHERPIPESLSKLGYYSWKNRAEIFLQWIVEPNQKR